MAHQLFNWFIFVSLIGVLVYFDVVLWTWVLKFARAEWRKFRGDATTSPRYGRVRILGGDGGGPRTRVQVVPCDGGAAIDLPVISAQVRGMVGEPVTARLHLHTHEIALASSWDGVEIKGSSGNVSRPLLGPVVNITEGGEPVRARGFIWAINARERFPHLYILGRRAS